MMRFSPMRKPRCTPLAGACAICADESAEQVAPARPSTIDMATEDAVPTEASFADYVRDMLDAGGTDYTPAKNKAWWLP